jgi:uncharacterized membrane protein
MPPLAIGLLICAAVAHAAWNFQGKRLNPSAAFFLVATVAAAIALTLAIVWLGDRLRHAPQELWWLLALSGASQALYYIGIAGAYQAGQLSIAYPLARAVPILVVAAVSVALGADRIGSLGLLAMLVVALGCLALPMRHFRDVSLSNYLNRSGAFALLAAAGTVGYSLTDSRALALLTSPEGGHEPLSRGAASVLFLAMESWSTVVVLGAWTLALPGQRQQLGTMRRQRRLIEASVTGLVIAVNYGMVLAAMTLVRDVSYVVAFRQLSVPLGAALGMMLLNEPAHVPKLVAIAVITVGLVLVAIG